MQIDTKAYGPIDVNERQRITLQRGLFGFDEYVDFVLLDSEQPPFYWFQAVQEKDIAFVLISPFVFRPEYTPGVSPEDLEALGLESAEDENLLIFAIVTIPPEQTRMTANLQGPILINRQTRQGRQIISNDDRWQVRHNIMEEMRRERDRACLFFRANSTSV